MLFLFHGHFIKEVWLIVMLLISAFSVPFALLYLSLYLSIFFLTFVMYVASVRRLLINFHKPIPQPNSFSTYNSIDMGLWSEYKLFSILQFLVQPWLYYPICSVFSPSVSKHIRVANPHKCLQYCIPQSVRHSGMGWLFAHLSYPYLDLGVHLGQLQIIIVMVFTDQGQKFI